MAVVIDVMTWAVLVPLLVANPDPKKAAYWSDIMYSASSYLVSGSLPGPRDPPPARCSALCRPLAQPRCRRAAAQLHARDVRLAPALHCAPIHPRPRAPPACPPQQHGFNAAMVLGELALNRAPPCFTLGSGLLALWNSLFGVWSTLFFIRTGRFIYPFLEAHKPRAWLVYLGLYLGLWAASLAPGAGRRRSVARCHSTSPSSRSGRGMALGRL